MLFCFDVNQQQQTSTSTFTFTYKLVQNVTNLVPASKRNQQWFKITKTTMSSKNVCVRLSGPKGKSGVQDSEEMTKTGFFFVIDSWLLSMPR